MSDDASETETEAEAEAEAEAETEAAEAGAETEPDKEPDSTEEAAASKDEAPEEGDAVGEPVDAEQGKSLLDTLDLARGEVQDDDLNTLQEAIDNLDFATRKANKERLARLDGLVARLSDLAAQIRREERTAESERELTPDQLERYQALVDEGVAAGEKKNLGEAERLLEEAVRLHPDGLDGLFYLGVTYGFLAHQNIVKMEFYDDYVRDEVYVEKSQICYDAVLAQDPTHLPSLNNLATLCSMRDNRDEAAEYLRRIVNVDPQNESDTRIVGEARSQLKELESI